MEDGFITIKITIAQRIIELKIQKEWERYYREAEKIINDSFFNFAKQWTFKDYQDILSKLLISEVVKNIECNERLQEYEEDLIPKMIELNELADKIHID
ncbi:MAG: cell division protein ZapA [Bacteroidetes bacterium]|nr:cell division protein ZapA [Bacteroidota bacterium]MCL1968340.1 cell division protein ZapA [Bacteroidota bacterium]